MRVNRRFLYWGVFLAAIGGMVVAADLRALDSPTIANALRLWPLAFVAIGLGLVLRRTQLSLPGGLLAAAVPGLMLGGGFALAPRIAVDCGAAGAPSSVATQQGTFDGPARISVTAGCGSLIVGTAPGNGWQLQTGDGPKQAPIIDSSPQALSIDTGGHGSWHFPSDARDTWQLALPTSPIDILDLVVNAGHGQIDLASATIGSLDLTTNAASTSVDLTQAKVGSVSGTVNAGMLSFRLPANGDLNGSIEVNAGALQVCVPSGVGLRIHRTGVLNGMSVDGLNQPGRDWQSPDYASAAHHADLSFNVNLGGVEINPIGGCK
jgi:hypothetical protein